MTEPTRRRRMTGLGITILCLLCFLMSHQQGVASMRPTSETVKQDELQTATFAGGCFWCMEPAFDHLDGVVSTTSGYTGGRTANPTYEEVSSGVTGHAEALRVVFDPAKVTYQQLLDVFWRNIDPVTANAQFCDHGTQYRSAIFTHGEEQQKLALASKKALETSNRLPGPVVTQIVPAGSFYPAEEYHQDYYRKNPVRYYFYRLSCGRDSRLKELWGDAAGH